MNAIVTDTYKVLSIDAWGNQEDGYEWNQWFDVGSIALDLSGNLDKVYILGAMIANDYLNHHALELADVEDDGYNIVIVDKTTREPLFAIDYTTNF